MVNVGGRMLCNPGGSATSATEIKDVFARLVWEAIRELGYERYIYLWDVYSVYL